MNVLRLRMCCKSLFSVKNSLPKKINSQQNLLLLVFWRQVLFLWLWWQQSKTFILPIWKKERVDWFCKLHSVKSVDKAKHVTNNLLLHLPVVVTENILVPELTRQLNFRNFCECCFSISNSVENYKSFSTAVLESKNQSVGFTMWIGEFRSLNATRNISRTCNEVRLWFAHLRHMTSSEIYCARNKS